MAEERIPIVRFRDLLLASIQVELTDRVAVQLKEDITLAVESTHVKGLILDLTGIDFMDSYTSRALRDVSVMAKLMGVATVVCGMHPAIAMTLVEMGIEIKGVPMALNLDAAMQMFRKDTGRSEAPDEIMVAQDGEHEELWVEV